MISTQGFEANENRMELLPDTAGVFPCICKYVDLANYVGHSVPWHYHQRAEINLLISGEAMVGASEKQIALHPGEAVFISSNTLHMLEPACEGSFPRYYTLFFDADFLTGGYDSILSKKYILPVTGCRELQSFHVRSDTPEGIRMLNILLNLVDLFQDEPFGYEFTIRAALSDFFLLLFKATESVRLKSASYGAADETRIRKMMDYIEQHFAEKILLEDIGAAAGISGRECARCFSRTLQQSPMEYLSRYRIRVAAGRIVETDDPIGQIAEECGFSSDSYFGKVFRAALHTSPREYRKGRRE